MKEQEFLKELKEIDLLQQAMGILGWDNQTGMPEKPVITGRKLTAIYMVSILTKKLGNQSKKRSAILESTQKNYLK